MDIASRSVEGTVVTLWLPRARNTELAAPAKKGKKAAPRLAARCLRVLLVDDDVLVSMEAADMLIDLGHGVTEAASAAQAFMRIRT
jgi:hypothetical protein